MTRILPLLAVVALAWALVTHLRWMGGFRLYEETSAGYRRSMRPVTWHFVFKEAPEPQVDHWANIIDVTPPQSAAADTVPALPAPTSHRSCPATDPDAIPQLPARTIESG
jgi:hypothetical protein